MLNRILNITAGSDFNKAAKPIRSSRQGKVLSYANYDGHDSIAISPAYSFLLRHKWNVKELNVLEDKVYINFFLSEFEFITSVFLKQINQLANLEYTVIKDVNIDGKKYDLAVDFLVNIAKTEYNEEALNTNFTELTVFFEKLLHLKINPGINSADKKLIYGLLEEYGADIQEEFNSVNNCLFIFIEKYFNFKINGWPNNIKTNGSVFVTNVRPLAPKIEKEI